VKLSLYGLDWSSVKRVRDAFFEVAEKYIKEFKIA
jgi:Cys-tRNA synthase (O-phospho-L-seryl-tRNA:Cys-tRNA synthase)